MKHIPCKFETIKLWLSTLLLFITFYGKSQSLYTLHNLPAGYTIAQLRYINDIAIDANNNSWVAFQKIGLGKFDGSNWVIFNSTSSFPNDTVLSIACGNGLVIAGTESGISVFNGSSWMHYDHLNSPLPVSGVRTVEINGTTIWAGTSEGIYRFDGSIWSHFHSGNSSLGNDTINCISFNNNNAVAIGTNNGSYIYNSSVWTIISSAGLPSTIIADCEFLTDTEVWLSLKDGSIYFYDGIACLPISSIFSQTYPGFLPFPVQNGFCMKKAHGKILLHILSNSSTYNHSLCTIDSLHQIQSYRVYPPANIPINSILFDINNTNISLIENFIQSTGLGSFFSLDLSNTTQTYLTPDLLNPSVLNINEVAARINTNGSLHCDLLSQTPLYEVPIGSNKMTVYASGLWVGGLDSANQLHLAASTYQNQGAMDFQAGPLDTITGQSDSATAILYNRTWKVSKLMIDDFIYNFQQGNIQNGSFKIPDVILNWPAHGTGTHSRTLAPFTDTNNDGIYNPYDGDCPEIDGDQEIWFIFNDQKLHAESSCASMGIEIHGKAYAYSCSSSNSFNSVINHTTFYRYKIINRSSTTYHSSKIGLFVDNDLGDLSDDKVGCNIFLNSGIAYNGHPDDSGPHGYGSNPPFQNATILKGPLADDNDEVDNDHDSTIDEPGECNMLSSLLYYENVFNTPTGIPSTCIDYFNYLSGIWLDNQPITFGGDGRNPGVPTNYMYSGTTNLTFPGQNWTMAQSNDIRYIISSGDFTLNPGENRTIDFAYIYTRDTVGSWPADATIFNEIEVAKVIQWYNDGISSCPVLQIPLPNSIVSNISIQPNPATNSIHFTNLNQADNYSYSIKESTGRYCMNGYITNNSLNISALTPGVYQILLKSELSSVSLKFVKL